MTADPAASQEPLLANITSRKTISLNGRWQYIMDPYETGFYDFRWQEKRIDDRSAYWNSDKPANKTELKEYGFSDQFTLRVPGDWNSQAEKFLYYEGSVWYKRTFSPGPKKAGARYFIYFGAVNYKADVYLNGKKLGGHKGGFTAFNVEVPAELLRAHDNELVLHVDNRRYKDEIPTLNTDWWNYGGITRDVYFVEVPEVHIQDYSIALQKDSRTEVVGWIQVKAATPTPVTLEIPELNWKREWLAVDGRVNFSDSIPGLQLWSPEKPRLYRVVVSVQGEKLSDRIGFRDIQVKGNQVFLNGEKIFLRSVCVHEEMPKEGRRAWSAADARKLLAQARLLNANMVRLAHYPHNENMARMADSMGIMVWSEIPVYWTIDFTDPEVLKKATTQLHEMIARDHNRASVIIWSVGNETPVNESRTAFMRSLLEEARRLDGTRLVSAALLAHGSNGVTVVDDPLGEYVDLLCINEYYGWYIGLPSSIRDVQWQVKYDKPFFISETGGEALGGFHGDSLTRWSEEYQAWVYREQINMFRRLPPGFCGVSPWLLNDFRSPRRNNPYYQQGWNNKGLFDRRGREKLAAGILRSYYHSLIKR